MSENLDVLSTFEMLRVMNHEDHKIADCVGRALHEIERAVDAAADRLAHGGRMFYIGAGTSGTTGVLDASECPRRSAFLPSWCRQSWRAGSRRSIRRPRRPRTIRRWASVTCSREGSLRTTSLWEIAASGRTPYPSGRSNAAKRLGAMTIGISCTPRFTTLASRRHRDRGGAGSEVLVDRRGARGYGNGNWVRTCEHGSDGGAWHVHRNPTVNVQPKNEKLVARGEADHRGGDGRAGRGSGAIVRRSGRQAKVAIGDGKPGRRARTRRSVLRQSAGHVRFAVDGAPLPQVTEEQGERRIEMSAASWGCPF